MGNGARRVLKSGYLAAGEAAAGRSSHSHTSHIGDDFPTDLHRSTQIRRRNAGTESSVDKVRDCPCIICADLCESVGKFMVAANGCSRNFRGQKKNVDHGRARKFTEKLVQLSMTNALRRAITSDVSRPSKICGSTRSVAVISRSARHELVLRVHVNKYEIPWLDGPVLPAPYFVIWRMKEVICSLSSTLPRPWPMRIACGPWVRSSGRPGW